MLSRDQAKALARQQAAEARTKDPAGYRTRHLAPDLAAQYERPTCAGCGGTMAILEEGQTTHPACTEPNEQENP
jgi:hypothetical protein